MFGFFKKRIPAPQSERETLVRGLYKHRCENDASIQAMAAITGDDPMDVPVEMLMHGSIDSAILSICEQFYTLRDQGATEEFATKTLNELHSAAVSMAGQELPITGRAMNLFQYLRHYVDCVNTDGAPVSDSHLIDAIQQIKEHYRR